MHLNILKFIFFIQLVINFRECTPVQSQRLSLNPNIQKIDGNAVDTAPIFQVPHDVLQNQPTQNQVTSTGYNDVTESNSVTETIITSSTGDSLLDNISSSNESINANIINETSVTEILNTTISPILNSTTPASVDSTISVTKEDDLVALSTSENQNVNEGSQDITSEN